MSSEYLKLPIAALLTIGLLLTAVPAQAKGLKSVSWGKQLFKRSSLTNLKSVPGFDVGHNPMKRNSANPAHMRWETRRANRSRPGRAKASARRRGIIARYF
jgi:hypothetical protein